MKHFRLTVLLLLLPLILELIVYLARMETYPGYMPFFSRIQSIGFALFYFALLFVAAAVIVSFALRLLRLNPLHALPSALYGLFLAITMARLLPYESGITAQRLAVFSAATMAALGCFFLLRRMNPSEKRVVAAVSLFCVLGAIGLAHLFQFPYVNPWLVLALYSTAFALFLFLPARPLVLLCSVILILVLRSPAKPDPFLPSGNMQPYRRVILVGVDGLSPGVVFELAREGKLPTLSRLMKDGTFGTLRTLDVPFSPLIWNTIYTGTQPQQHGIMAFAFTGVAGAPPFLSLWLDNWTNSDWIHQSTRALAQINLIRTLPPALSRHRLQPALWNIVDQNGSGSIVIGGWTTYPPEIIKGLYISDHAITLGKATQGGYYPPSKEVDESLVFNPDVSFWPQEIRRYEAKDERAHRLAMSLFPSADQQTRFMFSYYCAMDAYGHHYGTKIDMKNTSASERSSLLASREQVYRKIDALLGDYLPLVDDETLLIICSDHGWHFDKRQHSYPVDGILVAYGKGIAAKTTFQGDVYQIAPTVLYALGLPPNKDFHSRPLRELFKNLISEPAPKIYQPPSRFYEVEDSKAFEKEKMEELIDLQYINR